MNGLDFKPEILSKEYVFDNGILDCDQFYYEDYDENGVFNEQVYDKPREDGGKPMNGLIYEVYITGHLRCYYYLENGFDIGPNVSFFENGTASEYYLWDKKNGMHYEYTWFESGVLKSFWRKNSHDVSISDIYNEEGVMINKTFLKYPLSYTYNCLNPDDKTEVIFHENGMFKKIKWEEPSRNQLYSAVEFDKDGNITYLK